MYHLHPPVRLAVEWWVGNDARGRRSGLVATAARIVRATCVASIADRRTCNIDLKFGLTRWERDLAENSIRDRAYLIPASFGIGPEMTVESVCMLIRAIRAVTWGRFRKLSETTMRVDRALSLVPQKPAVRTAMSKWPMSRLWTLSSAWHAIGNGKRGRSIACSSGTGKKNVVLVLPSLKDTHRCRHRFRS